MCNRFFARLGLLLLIPVWCNSNSIKNECQSPAFICWNYHNFSYQINRFNLHLIQWDSGGVVSDINLFIPPESGPLSGGGSSDENGILLTELIQNRVYLYDSLFQFKSRVDLPDLLAKDHQKKHLIYYSHKYGLLVYLTDTGKFHILREKENKLQVVQTLLSPKGGLYLEVVGEKLRIYSDHACISQVGLSLNVFSMIFTDCSDF